MPKSTKIILILAILIVMGGASFAMFTKNGGDNGQNTNIILVNNINSTNSSNVDSNEWIVNVNDEKNGLISYISKNLGVELDAPKEFYATTFSYEPYLLISNGKLPIEFQNNNEIIFELYIQKNVSIVDELKKFTVGRSYSNKLGETETLINKTVKNNNEFNIVELTARKPIEGIATIFRYYYIQHDKDVYSMLLRIPFDFNNQEILERFEQIVFSIQF